MTIRFTKMHGCGNDYIFVDCMHGELPDADLLAKEMSRRRFSVGSDGLIEICPSDAADAKMKMFNADGSEGKMCGNGIRCVGKYIFESGISKKTELEIETLSGIRRLSLKTDGDKVVSVTVDMGRADFSAKSVPVMTKDTRAVNAPVSVFGKEYRITCVSVGNPHAVIFMQGVDAADIGQIGRFFEKSPLFPEGVNTEFAEIVGKNEIKMRVWERGSGETLACGTGACAAAAAAVLTGSCEKNEPITIRLPGGTLSVTVTDDFGVFLTGGAEKIYDGVYCYERKTE